MRVVALRLAVGVVRPSSATRSPPRTSSSAAASASSSAALFQQGGQIQAVLLPHVGSQFQVLLAFEGHEAGPLQRSEGQLHRFGRYLCHFAQQGGKEPGRVVEVWPQAGSLLHLRIKLEPLCFLQTGGRDWQMQFGNFEGGGMASEQCIQHTLVFFWREGAGGINHLSADLDRPQGGFEQLSLAARQGGLFARGDRPEGMGIRGA